MNPQQSNLPQLPENADKHPAFNKYASFLLPFPPPPRLTLRIFAGGLLEYFIGSTTSLTSLTMWMPLLVSIGLMIPDTMLIMRERGVRVGLFYLYGKIVTLAPMYYLFIAQTRAYHFARTMAWGGADYYVTKRAVSVSHVPVHELFMTYAHSHFYPAAELLVLLAVASGFNAPSDLINSVWMLW